MKTTYRLYEINLTLFYLLSLKYRIHTYLHDELLFDKCLVKLFVEIEH